MRDNNQQCSCSLRDNNQQCSCSLRDNKSAMLVLNARKSLCPLWQVQNQQQFFKNRKCSMKFPKNQLRVHSNTTSLLSSKMWDQMKTTSSVPYYIIQCSLLSLSLSVSLSLPSRGSQLCRQSGTKTTNQLSHSVQQLNRWVEKRWEALGVKKRMGAGTGLLRIQTLGSIVVTMILRCQSVSKTKESRPFFMN